jgi:hypothetical protein
MTKARSQSGNIDANCANFHQWINGKAPFAYPVHAVKNIPKPLQSKCDQTQSKLITVNQIFLAPLPPSPFLSNLANANHWPVHAYKVGSCQKSASFQREKNMKIALTFLGRRCVSGKRIRPRMPFDAPSRRTLPNIRGEASPITAQAAMLPAKNFQTLPAKTGQKPTDSSLCKAKIPSPAAGRTPILPRIIRVGLEHSRHCPLLCLTTLMTEYGQKRGF